MLQERYRIDELLGVGGMGAVYRGIDLRFNTAVAIKENGLVTPEGQKQFAREATLLHQLRHSGLPRVTDHFFVPWQGQYLIMDYVEGNDLNQILARYGRVPESQALVWIHQVLDALSYLHSHNVIHRDIKPANIRITPQGRVVLVDFGIAKVHDPALRTTTGARGVTPGFAPPEQYGQGRTDARSDIYSVGATLYAILTGRTPPDSIDLLMGVQLLIPPRRFHATISSDAQEAILRAMEVQPTNRFQSADEFRAALLDCIKSHQRSTRSSEVRLRTSAPAQPLSTPKSRTGTSIRAEAHRAEKMPPTYVSRIGRLMESRYSYMAWTLWLRWVLATTLGWAIGWVVGDLLGTAIGQVIEDILDPGGWSFAFLASAIIASWISGLAVAGVGQWIFLRKRFEWAAYWLRSSALTAVLGLFVAAVGTILAIVGPPSNLYQLVSWAVPLFISLGQDVIDRYLVLRWHAQKASRWLFIGFTALLTQFGLLMIVNEVTGGIDLGSIPWILEGTTLGAWYGILTGLALVGILSSGWQSGDVEPRGQHSPYGR